MPGAAQSKNHLHHILSMEGTYNTRDLGGYSGFQGKTVKWIKLFRSDDLHTITDKDQQFLKSLGLGTIIDYRNKDERNKRPNQPLEGVTTYILNPDDEIAALASADIQNDQAKIDLLIEKEKSGQLNLEKDFLQESMLGYVRGDKGQAVYREVLLIHASQETDVILQHCRGGKDRTGYGSALVLFSLGVSEEEIIDDYILTAEYNKERNANRMKQYMEYTDNANVLMYLSRAMETRTTVLESAIAEMKKMAGSPIDYIKNILGLGQQELLSIQGKYLD